MTEGYGCEYRRKVYTYTMTYILFTTRRILLPVRVRYYWYSHGIYMNGERDSSSRKQRMNKRKSDMNDKRSLYDDADKKFNINYLRILIKMRNSAITV